MFYPITEAQRWTFPIVNDHMETSLVDVPRHRVTKTHRTKCYVAVIVVLFDLMDLGCVLLLELTNSDVTLQLQTMLSRLILDRELN